MSFADDQFVEYLKSRKGNRVYLKPYVGNSGDDLIWMGNEALLKELGLEQVLNPNKADLILWPGGNPTMWVTNLDGWQTCWSRWPNTDFVIAPATFQKGEHDWPKMMRNAPKCLKAAFARDPKSYQNLAEAGLGSDVKIGTAHDPAFHLRNTDWIRQHREACTSEFVLASFRSDHEAAMGKSYGGKMEQWCPTVVKKGIRRLNRRNLAKARLEKVRAHVPEGQSLRVCDAPKMSFQSFVECVRSASQVHTDRLHCMILAVLLGKDVFAYPTAYGKLECVYEYSIKPWASLQIVQE